MRSMRSKRIKGRSKIGDKGGMDIRAPYSFREKKEKKQANLVSTIVELKFEKNELWFSTRPYRFAIFSREMLRNWPS